MNNNFLENLKKTNNSKGTGLTTSSKLKANLSLSDIGSHLSSLANLNSSIKPTNKDAINASINNASHNFLQQARNYLETNYQELVIIIDKSGSCGDLVNATIDAVNDLITTEKMKGLNTLVTLVLFSNEKKYIYFRKPIEEIRGFNYNAYGYTYLYDTLGETINDIRHFQASDVNEGKTASNTFVAIMTDGENTHTRHYNLDSVRDLISQTQDNGWKYFFIGALDNAKEIARDLGIRDCDSVKVSHDTNGMFNGIDFLKKGISYYQLESQPTLRLEIKKR